MYSSVNTRSEIVDAIIEFEEVHKRNAKQLKIPADYVQRILGPSFFDANLFGKAFVDWGVKIMTLGPQWLNGKKMFGIPVSVEGTRLEAI